MFNSKNKLETKMPQLQVLLSSVFHMLSCFEINTVNKMAERKRTSGDGNILAYFSKRSQPLTGAGEYA